MKAIYQPKGKAGEYAKYACNFYVGCSNDCDYCYCKRGLLAHAMGGTTPTLKKCFKDEDDAIETFGRELMSNLSELQKHGLFFTFTSDPMLPETRHLTEAAVEMCMEESVPVKILTKRADFDISTYWDIFADSIAFGFTLTGCDDQEPNASPNEDRARKIRDLHYRRFKTFASIEPVIDLDKSLQMIKLAAYCGCDMFKIGLMSGKRNYTPYEVSVFMEHVHQAIHENNFDYGMKTKVYWKDSVIDFVKAKRENLPQDICVGANYNLFTGMDMDTDPTEETLNQTF